MMPKFVGGTKLSHFTKRSKQTLSVKQTVTHPTDIDFSLFVHYLGWKFLWIFGTLLRISFWMKSYANEKFIFIALFVVILLLCCFTRFLLVYLVRTTVETATCLSLEIAGLSCWENVSRLCSQEYLSYRYAYFSLKKWLN